MSQSGEAAEQIVNMATNVTVKGVEAVASITGKGALSLVTFLIAALKDQKRTKGKVRMKSFEGKPTKVFVIKNSDMATFTQEAKKYGVKYAAIINKKHPNGICDVIVNSKDAARVNRIAERFALSTVDVDKIRKDIEKNRKSKNTEQQRTNPPAEKQAKSADNPFKDDRVPQPQQTTHKQPVNIGENPTRGRSARKASLVEKSNPSEPSSKNSASSERGSIERSSVKGEIKEIKQERRDKSKSQPTKNRQTTHKRPRQKSKNKYKGR